MEVDGDPLTEFLFDAVIFVGVWWVIALFVRWAWYRGVPRLRAGVRGWRENGR
jgi:hypothetical protein